VEGTISSHDSLYQQGIWSYGHREAQRKRIELYLALQDTPNASMNAKDWQHWEELRAEIIKDLHIFQLGDIAHLDDICRALLKNPPVNP